MSTPALTFATVNARPVVLKLRRPVVARIATITEWPLILIDLTTEEGIVGRSYLEPYTIEAMRYLVPALHDFGAMLKGRRVAPLEFYELARKSLHFVGYQGLSDRRFGARHGRLGRLGQSNESPPLRASRRNGRTGPGLQ
jgi:mandelate racemase